ncbi:MAG: DUF5719 family protein [Bowdeniella nasicola]|nr:DUF5719 family protein [Bowdeniella nasicola]
MRFRILAARFAAVLSALVLVTAGLGLVIFEPDLPMHDGTVSAEPVTLPPAAAVTVCTPGPQQTSSDSGDEEFGNQASATHTLTTVIAQQPSTPVLGHYRRAGTAETFPLPDTARGVSIYRNDNETLPGIVVVEPGGAGEPQLAGSTISINDGGDLRGLSAAPCIAPSSDMWLLGGATTVGSSATLVMTNAGQTTASVAVELLSERGPLPQTATTRTVAAGASESLVLEGIGSEVERLAVHLTTSGGEVAAAVQYHGLSGITPQGSGVITPSAPAARSLYIPGVQLSGDEGDDVVRLVNPHEETTTVSVQLLGKDGTLTLPGASDIPIDAHSVQDLSLTGVDAGDYTVMITASEPLVAGVQLDTPGDEDRHAHTWLPTITPAPTLLVPVVDDHDLSAQVQLTNPSDTAVDVTAVTIGTNGEEASGNSMTLKAHTTTNVEIAPGTRAVRLEADSPIVAATVLKYRVGDETLRAVLPATALIRDGRVVHIDLGGSANQNSG